MDLLQHPGQQPSKGLKQVLFHLNFYPGGEVVNLDVHEDFAFCSSEAPGAPHAAQTSVPASEPRSQPARSAAELLALYGPGVGVAPPAPKRRRATGTVLFEFLPGGGG